MDISTINMVMDHMKEYIWLKMVEEVAGDDSAVGLIKVGKLQDDPTVYLQNLMIQPDNETPHQLHKDGEYGITVGAAYYIGGGYNAFWWRNFIINFQLFFMGEEDRDNARRNGNVIVSRLQYTINTMPLPFWNPDGDLVDSSDPEATQTDSFGESPRMVVVSEWKHHESGGPGDFIWRGEMKVSWLTEIDTSD